MARLPEMPTFRDDAPSAERAAAHAQYAARLLVTAPAVKDLGPIAGAHATLAIYHQREAELGR